ncbi:MAG TPA: hypothetical protein VHT70_03570 [Candidatus Saccharimonadales bacterium]|jgi:hypothetical protein|nr:hypothetical protein [Candidatus Saccharimonadales bacterium]
MSELPPFHNRPSRFINFRRLIGAAVLGIAGLGTALTGQHSVQTLAHQTPEASELARVHSQEKVISERAEKEHPNLDDPLHYQGNEVDATLDFGKVAHEAWDNTLVKVGAATAGSVAVLGLSVFGLGVAARRSSEAYYANIQPTDIPETTYIVPAPGN